MRQELDATQIDDYYAGRVDGERDAEGKPILFILLGSFWSVISIVIAIFLKFEPPQSKLEGKSNGYVLGYTEAYHAKARGKNIMFSIIGCVISPTLSIILRHLNN